MGNDPIWANMFLSEENPKVMDLKGKPMANTQWLAAVSCEAMHSLASEVAFGWHIP